MIEPWRAMYGTIVKEPLDVPLTIGVIVVCLFILWITNEKPK